MLRMQNVIYERGSAARQAAAGASAGAGLGQRLLWGTVSARGELGLYPGKGR